MRWTQQDAVQWQVVEKNSICIAFTLKNAGLNTTQRWVKYGRTQRLACLDPAVGLNI